MEIVRAPRRASLCELYLAGLIPDADVDADGRVAEDVRARAEADAGAAEPPPPRLRRARSFVTRGRRRTTPSTTPLQPRPSPATTTPASPRDTTTNDPLKCSICYARKRTHAFVPCFHLHACEPCANRIVAHMPLCPLCRRVVERTQRVWT